MPTLNVSRYGGTITVAVASSPSNSTITYGSVPSEYATRNGNVITVSANTGYDREFTLTLTATTNSNPSYYGTATSTSAWTVSQVGPFGPVPNEKFVTLNLTCTNNNGNARVPEMYLNVYGDDSGDGPEIFNSARRKFDNVWPLTDRGTVGDSDNINVVITASNGGYSEYNGTYYYNYGLGTPTTSGTVTVNGSNPVEICNITIPISSLENTFFIEMYDPSYN